MNVTIIDYGMSNLRSVSNACEFLGASVQVISEPDKLREAEKIILPGVGAFGDGINNLRSKGWTTVLKEEVMNKHKPFLGICLGMQLLATTGTEYGSHEGLNWICGKVIRLQSNEPDIRIPHIGWNNVCFTKKNGLYATLRDTEDFYFAHSYILQPDNSSVISGICSYGNDFVASIEKDNIYAVQFHPEKSHRIGLKILNNFLNIKINL